MKSCPVCDEEIVVTPEEVGDSEFECEGCGSQLRFQDGGEIVEVDDEEEEEDDDFVDEKDEEDEDEDDEEV